MYYYGDRSCNCHPSEDIGIKYFSTSTLKLFINDQKTNPQDYKYKVIKIFETNREDAKQLEVNLHEKFDVKNHSKFINRANQSGGGFDRTGLPAWNSGGHNTKASEKMKKIIYVDGATTTTYKESAKKHSITLQNKITFEGREITLSEKYGIERSRERTQQGKKYKLLNIFDNDFEEILFANELRKISHNLQTKTKENYLGQSKFGVSRLKAQNKESLIGLYTELI